MRTLTILTAVVAMAVAACGEGGGQPAATDRPGAPSESAAPPADGEQTITGVFGGDAQLEGGCAWIDQGGKRWNVQYPQGYTVEFSPLRLTGPDGFLVEDGDTVTVTGRELRDVMTTCQIGPVFQATSVTRGA